MNVRGMSKMELKPKCHIHGSHDMHIQHKSKHSNVGDVFESYMNLTGNGINQC